MRFSKKYRVQPGHAVHLDRVDPDGRDDVLDRAAAGPLIQHYADRLRALQYRLYAESSRSLLICLQAMDAGGKDGAIRHVLGYMNPQGCRVQAFKQPTEEELAHDFLWRAHRATPEKGQVVIFNRSHYEDVLVTRVHGMIDKASCRQRYRAIEAFERQLTDHGTHILKFYLHISKDEQLQRLKTRLDDPERWWKVSEADFKEREYWADYQRAFEDVFRHCSSKQAPWFIVPANHKWNRNLIISRIVVEYLESMDLQLPQATVDIDAIRRKYCQDCK